MNHTLKEMFSCSKRIVEDGGDTWDCELGPYCLRCIISTVFGNLNDVKGINHPFFSMNAIPGYDDPMLKAIEKIVAHGDTGIKHTRESAMRLIDAVLISLGEE